MPYSLNNIPHIAIGVSIILSASALWKVTSAPEAADLDFYKTESEKKMSMIIKSSKNIELGLDSVRALVVANGSLIKSNEDLVIANRDLIRMNALNIQSNEARLVKLESRLK